MHELSLAQALVEEVERRAQNEKAQKVTEVKVSLGKFSGVWRESIEFCYPILCEGTLLEGSTLAIDEIPLTLHCPQCQKDSHPQHFRLKCEHCQSTQVEITAGKEFKIISMEFQ